MYWEVLVESKSVGEEKYRYSLTTTGDSYGIAVVNKNTGESLIINDLSSVKLRVMNLVKLLSDYEVTITSIPDIVEDWLCM